MSSVVSRLVRRFLPGRAAPEARLLFLHVPKCGGTSVHEAIRQLYLQGGASVVGLDPFASKAASDVLGEDLLSFRARILLYHLGREDVRYASGHYPFDQHAWDAYSRMWTFITVLRDPVARWYSLYFYNRYKQSDHFRIDVPLQDSVASKDAVFNGANYVYTFTRHIERNEAERSTGVPSAERVDEALKVIRRLPVVGLLEELDFFVRDLERVLGQELVIPHRNRNPKPDNEQREAISEDVRARVVEHCKPNQIIYNAVRERIRSNEGWLLPG